MSRIPDCRTDESYNEKYLNDTDAEFVAGIDWCTLMIVSNYFENMDIYENEFEGIEADTEEEQALLDFMEKHPDETEAFLKIYAETVKETLLHYIEMQRDEMITSMIDNMNDEEYETIKAEVDAGKRQNCIETYDFERNKNN